MLIISGYQLLNNFAVDVFKSDNKTRHRCGIYNKSEPVDRGGNITFNCHNIQGRYVNITKLEGRYQTTIVLCEVEIDGVLKTASNGIPQTPLTSTTTSTTTSVSIREATPSTTSLSSTITSTTTTVDLLGNIQNKKFTLFMTSY